MMSNERRLEIECIRWLAAPPMNNWITLRLADDGVPLSTPLASNGSRPNIAVNASPPRPPPDCQRKSRRLVTGAP